MTDLSLNPPDLRQLRALRAVARTGSFHRAAADLGYTQSAVSQQIKSLERHIGHQLLERTGTRAPAVPTPIGWLLLRHADAIFAQLDELAHGLVRANEGITGRVRIGFFQSIGPTLLPPVIRLVSQQMPNIELVLTEAECDLTLQAKVATGELDFAFAVGPLEEPVLDPTVLFEDPIMVLMRKDDALASSTTVDVHELRERRLATFGPSMHQRTMEARLRQSDGAVATVLSDDNATLAGVAASGTAVAVMSQLSIYDNEREDLVALEVSGLPPRIVTLARHREWSLDPAAQGVFDLIVDHIAGRALHDIIRARPPKLRLLDQAEKSASVA